MFYNIFTPISYNTNFESVLAHYRFGFCGGFCNPYASLFNGYSTFGAFANQFPSAYPTLCPDSYNIAAYSNNSAPMIDFNPFVAKVLRDATFSNNQMTTTFLQSPCSIYTQPSQPVVFTSSQNVTNPFKTTGDISAPSVNIKTDKENSKTTAPVKAHTETKSAAPQNHSSTNQAANSSIRNDFISTAQKYSYCNESDGSQHKFCINSTCKYDDPFDQEWCTDFVTYVVNEAYRKNGKTSPAGFGSHDVETLKNWAIHKNHFIRTSNKPQKGTYIAQNILPGDIIILNENGASHTGFVTKVDNNGTVHTIEGNRNDRVTTYAYSPNYPDISGFIRLT